MNSLAPQFRLLAFAVCVAALPLGMSAAAPASRFSVTFGSGAITSLKAAPADTNAAQFISPNRRLGDVAIKYRRGASDWQSIHTATLTNSGTFSSNDTEHSATYEINDGQFPALRIGVRFTIEEATVLWTLDL